MAHLIGLLLPWRTFALSLVFYAVFVFLRYRRADRQTDAQDAKCGL